jgi:hypothetical protein
MGADFIYEYIPVCNFTDDRKKFLESKINNMSEEDFRDYDIEYSKDDVLRSIDEYKILGTTREAGFLSPPGSKFGYYLTGGMSWGDVPTDIYSTIECLSVLFWVEFEKWALEDATGKSSFPMSIF